MRNPSLLLLGWLFFSTHQPAFAQDAKLIEAAKKEGGKVVVYTTMETFTLDAIKAAFERKTGLQVEYWRAGITDVLARALGEQRAGNERHSGHLSFDMWRSRHEQQQGRLGRRLPRSAQRCDGRERGPRGHRDGASADGGTHAVDSLHRDSVPMRNKRPALGHGDEHRPSREPDREDDDRPR